MATYLKIERWAIGDADSVPVLPTGLRGWRTDWADFLALGHPEPGSAPSESKKSVKFEPPLACHRLKCLIFRTDNRFYRFYVDPTHVEPDFCRIRQKSKIVV